MDAKFWETWREFEMQHGNKDTFREMLRIKRSVAAQFSVGVNLNVSAIADKLKEKKATPSQRPGIGSGPAGAPPKGSAVNIEEINLDFEGGEEEGEGDGMEITEKAIPAAVYGSSAATTEETKAPGAKERLKKSRAM